MLEYELLNVEHSTSKMQLLVKNNFTVV
jgi:hypothetical protein